MDQPSRLRCPNISRKECVDSEKKQNENFSIWLSPPSIRSTVRSLLSATVASRPYAHLRHHHRWHDEEVALDDR